MEEFWKWLGEDVGRVGCARDMTDFDPTFTNFITDVMDVYIDVLGSVMHNRVVSHLHRCRVVGIDGDRSREGSVELRKEVAKPDCLAGGMGSGKVLSFSGRLGHYHLAPYFPGDGAAGHHNHEARDRLPICRVPAPIGVTINDRKFGRVVRRLGVVDSHIGGVQQILTAASKLCYYKYSKCCNKSTTICVNFAAIAVSLIIYICTVMLQLL